MTQKELADILESGLIEWKIVLRGDTTANWTVKNPVLLNDEMGIEVTAAGKKLFKFGDGVKRWNDLPYGTANALSELTEDSAHRLVTDAEKAVWSAKAEVSDIPTRTSALENNGDGSSKFATETYVAGKVSSVYKSKGSVATYENLPTANQVVGDTYNVVAAHGNFPAGTNYVWTETGWDPLGGIFDQSDLVKNADIKAIARSGKLSDGTQDETHRLVADTEKAAWSAKAETSAIPTTSTQLIDSNTLLRITDTWVISGGKA